jgi:pullulanase
VALLALLLPVLAVGQTSTWAGPAFLDDSDRITVWLPEAAMPAALSGRVEVRVDGRAVAVRDVVGRERATRATDPNFVVLPGTFQSVLGGADWDPANESSRMVRVRDGVFELVVQLPKGRFEYKVALGGSWLRNYGAGFTQNGPNIALELPAPAAVRFVLDFHARTIRDSVNDPAHVTAPAEAPPRVDWARVEPPRGYQSVQVLLGRALSPRDISRPMTVRVANGATRTVIAREVLDGEAFFFPGDDLGSRWTPQRTTFKVWSPVASRVDLALFRAATGPAKRTIPMRRGTAGVWYAKVAGDLHGVYYQYHLVSYGQRRVAADIYGFAASADSSRSVVVDLSRTNPPGWPLPRLFQGKRHTDAIIYEAHVRDLTINPFSGVRPEWRGKYLGVSQAGTRVPGSDFPTSLDYLRDLGITHIHLLPFQDFNPAHSEIYNWGYETTLFNVPEEQYSTNRHDPFLRIREVKEMVMGLQAAGIGVVLDVVYNHSVPSEGPGSAFWELVPFYYFRTNDRGDVLNESGVGNALHDERPMVRKFISDSLEFWTREYRLDGYRFDLIGMFTRESNLVFAEAIRRHNPYAVIYGEPWTGGGPIRFGKGAQRGTTIAVFNDRFRGAFRGELDGTAPGFSMGGATDREALERAITGSVTDFTDSPQETVNYVSSHDNLTFWDRVAASLPEADRATRERSVRLAHAAVLLSQGMPFLEGGVQLGRTKGMNNNSFDAGDAANMYDWRRALEHRDLHAYFRGLIALRRSHAGFRLRTRDEVLRAVRFLPEAETPPGAIAFRLDPEATGADWPETLVAFNGSREGGRLTLPPGAWHVVVDAQSAGARPLREVSGSVELEPVSALVLMR